MITATLTLGLGAAGFAGAPVGAEESGTHCTFQHTFNLDPGLSYEHSEGQFTDPGGGTVECEGPAVSGSGTYVDEGTYEGTCQGGGTAEGDPSFTIGDQTFTDHIMITFGEPSTEGGVVHAEFEGEKTKGTIELTPTKGDCIANPVTEGRGVGEFTLK